MHRLFDGHPELWVMPGETFLHYNKHRWPNLSRSVEMKNFNIAYEHNEGIPVWHLFHASVLKKKQKNFEYDNPDFDIDFDRFLLGWRESMAACDQWSERKIIETYFENLFDRLASHPRRNTDHVVIKTPRLGLDHRRFFDLFPDGRLIMMRRSLKSYVGSELTRNGFPPSGLRDRARRYKLITRYTRLHRFAELVYDEIRGNDRVALVDYETLTEQSEAEMRRLASFTGISYDEILTVPSVYGRPWISNSSFREAREGTRGRVTARKGGSSGLTAFEETLVDQLYRRLPILPLEKALA
jgi:hypothetical protein